MNTIDKQSLIEERERINEQLRLLRKQETAEKRMRKFILKKYNAFLDKMSEKYAIDINRVEEIIAEGDL